MKRNASIALAFFLTLAALASAEWWSGSSGRDGDVLAQIATQAAVANRLREREVKALERIAAVLERMEARTPQPAERPGR